MPAALLSAEDREELLGKLTEMKSVYKKYDDEIRKLGQADSDTLVKIDKLTEDMVAIHKKHNDEAVKRIDEIEIKLTRKAAEMEPPRSVGQQFVESKQLIDWVKSGGRGGVAVQVKGPLSLERKDITGVSLNWPQMLPGVTALPHLPFGIRQLVPQGRTTSGAVEYLREETSTNNAAVVAEAAAKPKSDKTFTVQSAAVRTIAHYFKLSKQTFEDLPAVQSIVESNGVYGVKLEEDDQLLNGSGVAPNLTGFMTVAAAAPAAPVGGTGIDAIGTAIFDLAAKGYVPDGVAVNPADWGKIAMLKNTQGAYLFTTPTNYTSISNIWGVRIAMSSNMAAGNFLVGAFGGNSLLLDREEVNVQVAYQNEDDFIKNLVTVLVEERLTLLIFRAAAFEKGTVPAPTGLEAPPPPPAARTRT